MNETPSNQSDAAGLSWGKLKNLSPNERHLINWMRRQKNCSLLDVAVHFCLDEESAEKMLIPLIEKGYIQEIEPNFEKLDEDEHYYQVQYPPKRGQSLFKKLKCQQKLLDESDQELY